MFELLMWFIKRIDIFEKDKELKYIVELVKG